MNWRNTRSRHGEVIHFKVNNYTDDVSMSYAAIIYSHCQFDQMIKVLQDFLKHAICKVFR